MALSASGRKQSASVGVGQTLRAWIDEGRYKAGSRLPPEPELASSLGTSRVTLREALRALEADGLVQRRHGVGTFVTHAIHMANSLHRNFGVRQLIASMGLEPGTREAKWYETEPSPELTQRLRLDSGDKVTVLERVRTAQGEPVVYSLDYIPSKLIPASETFFMGDSLYALLGQTCDKVVEFGEARIQPGVADSKIASLLDVSEGELLLVLDQVDFESNGTPILYSKEYHLASVFEFRIVRKGPGRDDMEA